MLQLARLVPGEDEDAEFDIHSSLRLRYRRRRGFNRRLSVTMRTVETTGKTIEEAKQLAAEELGVPLDQIEFEILNEGSKALLGLSRTPAKVKATVAGDAGVDVSYQEFEDAEPEAQPVSEEAEPVYIDSSPGEWVMDLLKNILSAAQLDATPTLRSENETDIDINLEGPDVAILIGKHGQTLDALQYLLGIALNRLTEIRMRVTLDAEGYRDRHAQMLTAKALDYAKQVKDSGQEAVLDPQSSRDRRIMHMALADDAEIYTYSEGEGPDRHVVISPRK
jgi:predicted RNA-binding protein Jag